MPKISNENQLTQKIKYLINSKTHAHIIPIMILFGYYNLESKKNKSCKCVAI